VQSLLRFALIFAVGCSADTFAVTDAATTDAGSDASDAASDAAKDGAGIEAGLLECNVGTCGATAAVCCASFTLGAGPAITACTMESVATKCRAPAGCVTAFPIACSSKGVVRLCAEAADCDSDPVAKQCCNVFGGGAMAWVCATPAVANLGFTCK